MGGILGGGNGDPSISFAQSPQQQQIGQMIMPALARIFGSIPGGGNWGQGRFGQQQPPQYMNPQDNWNAGGGPGTPDWDNYQPYTYDDYGWNETRGDFGPDIGDWQDNWGSGLEGEDDDDYYQG